MGCEGTLIDLPFIQRPYPRALPGGAGWVANTAYYDCCYYDRMQERNPFGQPASRKVLDHFRAPEFVKKTARAQYYHRK